MNEEKKDMKIESRNYVLATSEYLSVSSPQYKLIRAELMEGKTITLYLFGIDLFYVTTEYNGLSDDEAKQRIMDEIVQAIGKLVQSDSYAPSNVYYGTHLPDGSFEISNERPLWDDGEWGVIVQ